MSSAKHIGQSRLHRYSRVGQILIGPCRQVAMKVDVAMTDPVIDWSPENPVSLAEEKGQFFRAL